MNFPLDTELNLCVPKAISFYREAFNSSTPWGPAWCRHVRVICLAAPLPPLRTSPYGTAFESIPGSQHSGSCSAHFIPCGVVEPTVLHPVFWCMQLRFFPFPGACVLLLHATKLFFSRFSPCYKITSHKRGFRKTRQARRTHNNTEIQNYRAFIDMQHAGRVGSQTHCRDPSSTCAAVRTPTEEMDLPQMQLQQSHVTNAPGTGCPVQHQLPREHKAVRQSPSRHPENCFIAAVGTGCLRDHHVTTGKVPPVELYRLQMHCRKGAA